MGRQPPYDPEVYEFVFRKVLNRRHFIPLHVDEVFDVQILDEKDLHKTGSLAANKAIANHYASLVMEEHPTDDTLDAIVANWYVN